MNKSDVLVARDIEARFGNEKFNPKGTC